MSGGATDFAPFQAEDMSGNVCQERLDNGLELELKVLL